MLFDNIIYDYIIILYWLKILDIKKTQNDFNVSFKYLSCNIKLILFILKQALFCIFQIQIWTLLYNMRGSSNWTTDDENIDCSKQRKPSKPAFIKVNIDFSKSWTLCYFGLKMWLKFLKWVVIRM